MAMRRSLPVLDPVALDTREGRSEQAMMMPRGGVRLSRSADRAVTVGGLVASGAFLVAATLALGLPESVRLGIWLPLHLALAGGAGTAIAAVMPFFAASLAAAAPVDQRIRIAAIAGICVGAIGVVLGVSTTAPTLAIAGGIAYLAALAGVAWATFRPLRRGLGPRGGIVAVAYGLALAQLTIGVALGTTRLTGLGSIVADWSWLKPAHAWLNVMGFVSLVIAGTSLHLLPIVLGSRIRRQASASVMVAALAVGPMLVAVGEVVRADMIVGLGIASEVVGAAALAAYAAGCLRDRATWTTDAGWHRMTAGHLLCAVAWFAVSVIVIASRALAAGSGPDAGSLAPVAGTLATGWIIQAILGAAGHLVPAIGPGDPARHAAQRRRLGTLATSRLVVLQVSVLAVTVGTAFDLGGPLAVGLIGSAVVVVSTLGLLLLAAATRAIAPAPTGGQTVAGA